MMSTSQSKPYDSSFAPPGFITKETNHPFSCLLIGGVVGIQYYDNSLILYYEDGHKALIHAGKKSLIIRDYEVPEC